MNRLSVTGVLRMCLWIKDTFTILLINVYKYITILESKRKKYIKNFEQSILKMIILHEVQE